MEQAVIVEEILRLGKPTTKTEFLQRFPEVELEDLDRIIDELVGEGKIWLYVPGETYICPSTQSPPIID